VKSADFMETHIRKATVGDINDILVLNSLLFEEDREYDKTLDMTWTRKRGMKYFLDRITRRDKCALVAVNGIKIVGYLVGGLCDSASYRLSVVSAELENMLVLEDFRGKGVGKKLVEEFLSWCKTNNVANISVTASAVNNRGIKFYKSLGFKDYNLTLEMSTS